MHMCLGEVLGQLGDLTGSLSCFKRAHILCPDHPLPFVNAARSYQNLNQPALAKAHLAHALQVDPSFPLTYVDLAQAKLQSGRAEEALEQLQRALDLARHVGDIRDVLTAMRVANIQLELEKDGLYWPTAV